MTCNHGPRHITFPGGEALLTANGNWTLYLAAHPTTVFSITACPVCKTPLWGLPPERARDAVDGVAHARNRGPRY